MELDNAERLAALRATGLLDSAPEAAFDRITRLASRMLRAPVALMSLVDDNRQFFKSRTGPLQDMNGSPLSHSICQHVVASEEPLVIPNTLEDQLVRDNGAVTDLGIRAYAGFPLRTIDGDVLGSFCVLDFEEHSWSQDDLEALEDLAAMVMTEIDLRIALNDERRLRLEKDEIARTLQASLLPPILPDITGMDVAAVYLPQGSGTLVGGDFYDVFESSGDRAHIVIGDVCGKGFNAARTSQLVRHVIRAAALRGDNSAASFRLVDEALKQQHHPFVAATHAVVERSGNTLACDITIAGLPLPLLITEGKVDVVGRYGMVLGAQIDQQLAFGECTISLQPGETLLLFTDGTTDNPAGGLTEYQLRDALNETLARSANEAVEQLLHYANPAGHDRPPKDDIAIVAVGNPSTGAIGNPGTGAIGELVTRA